MNKKGEITTQQIVILIVLILSFAVILFFLFRLNLGKSSEQDICRNSVVLRGTSALPTDTFPLNCQRQYVCLTKDGSCEQMVGPTIVKVKELDDIYEALAIQMQECWWMFGEGKINYVGDDLTKNNYCSICSQLAFDDSLDEIEEIEGGKISKDGLYEYLSKNEISFERETYLEYLFGNNDLNSIKGEYTFGNIETSKPYFILTGITSEVGSLGWVVSGVIVGATASAFITCTFTGVTCLIGLALVGGVTGAGAATVSDLINPEIGGIIVE